MKVYIATIMDTTHTYDCLHIDNVFANEGDAIAWLTRPYPELIDKSIEIWELSERNNHDDTGYIGLVYMRDGKPTTIECD